MTNTTAIIEDLNTATPIKEHLDLYTFKYTYNVEKEQEKDMYYFLNTGKRRKHIITYIYNKKL